MGITFDNDFGVWSDCNIYVFNIWKYTKENIYHWFNKFVLVVFFCMVVCSISFGLGDMMKKETKETIGAIGLYILLISGIIIGCAIPIWYMFKTIG